MPNNTTPTLVHITPRPTASQRIEDPDEVPALRRLGCRSYGACLDVAVENDWSGFHCGACQAYEPQTPQEAERDHVATLNFLAETRLLQQIRFASFGDGAFDDDDQDELPGSGFEDEQCSR
jgi:hypothetical protein